MLKDLLNDVLGGDRPASGRKPAERICRTYKFLSAIARKRFATIAELSRVYVL